MESPKRVGIFETLSIAVVEKQMRERGTQDRSYLGAGKSEATISFLWIMTVGPGTPAVYGTKTKSRDSAAAPRH